MTSLSPPTGGADSSVEAYESLRAHVLTGSSAGSPSGLLLLLRQGVAVWTVRRSSCSSEPRPAPPPAPASPTTNALHSALVSVLASMAMATKEART